MAKKDNKVSSRKVVQEEIFADSEWKIVKGELKRPPQRPGKTPHLFSYVAEKLPFSALSAVSSWMFKQNERREGVYLAHDSMGVARYGGRGDIFSRLAARHKRHPKELLYFSFYVIASKNHEREIETAILRAAGPQMILNQRKVRSDINPGNVKDYEAGTCFFERQGKRGRKAAV